MMWWSVPHTTLLGMLVCFNCFWIMGQIFVKRKDHCWATIVGIDVSVVSIQFWVPTFKLNVRVRLISKHFMFQVLIFIHLKIVLLLIVEIIYKKGDSLLTDLAFLSTAKKKYSKFKSPSSLFWEINLMKFLFFPVMHNFWVEPVHDRIKANFFLIHFHKAAETKLNKLIMDA